MNGRTKKMTPVAMELLVQLYYLADVQPQTAARRDAACFLVRFGLIEFQQPERPELGHRITEKGRVHVERLLALPVAEAPQARQIEPGSAAPRFRWSYWDEGASGSPAPVLSATEAASDALATGQLVPFLQSVFLEALTWDQQVRVLERLGWRKA